MTIEINDNMKSKVVDFLKSWKDTENWDYISPSELNDWVEEAADLLKNIIEYEDEDMEEDN